MLQDAIILDMLKSAQDYNNYNDSPRRITFMAGAMASGKTFTRNWLNEKGRFPLNTFVKIDTDVVRQRLPEWTLYSRQFPELAGKLTQQEAGFICEIATMACLQAGKNILVDGSLRDTAWYAKYFDFIRSEYPQFEISIFHVTAQRARDRAMSTGRVVPMALLEEALEQVPRSLQILICRCI